LKAQSKSSGATEATLPGVLALVRLLARDAAREAVADQANNRRQREMRLRAEEQIDVADQQG
jgi:hypothetical protein